MKRLTPLAALLIAGCGSAQSERAANDPSDVVPGYGIDYRQLGWTGPVLNQSFVGACASFGVAAVMNSQLRRQGRNESVSAMHIWAETKVHNGGGTSLVNVAMAPDEAWPYDPVKACLIATPDDECAKAGYQPGSGQLDPMINLEWVRANLAERYRIVSFDMVYSTGEGSQVTDKEVIFQHLAQGEALDGTILVGDGFASPGAVLSDYYVDDNNPGHAVALVGFRAVGGERQVLLQNSWGTGWGDNGFAWMPEHMIGRQLINVHRIGIADASAPMTPANGQCDGWHHLDLVLDACYSTCRNHIPTVNGRCNPLPANDQTQLSVCLDPRAVLAGKCGAPANWPGLPSFP